MRTKLYQEGGGGGGYTDTNDTDERLWAAAELWRSTGSGNFKSLIAPKLPLSNADPKNHSFLDWQNVSFLAYYSYWQSGNNNLNLFFKSYGDYLSNLQKRNPFGISISGYKEGAFAWGSNSVALTGAMQLIMTGKITGNQFYKQQAEEVVHYILGRNALNKSFITGYGDNPPKNIHYRPSMSKVYPLPPGFLAGGPNDSETGLNKYPSLRYTDNINSWTTNEVAINWNAPLAVVLSALTTE